LRIKESFSVLFFTPLSCTAMALVMAVWELERKRRLLCMEMHKTVYNPVIFLDLSP